MQRAGRLSRALVAIASVFLLVSGAAAQSAAPSRDMPSGNLRIDSGRFTVVAGERDRRMAHALLSHALKTDTFPGLKRPSARVLIAIAPNAAMFRSWVGPSAPEWGAAIAMPAEQRIIMQGAYGNSGAGNPLVVLRHELAHLALHEALGNLPARWFDEGYASVAAGEWDRATALETSVALMWRSLPDAEALDEGFYGGSSRAQYAYALAHLAVAEMQGIDTKRGLANFFTYWKQTGSYELAVRQAFGLTTSSFDAYWHQRVRRRYGALALLANLSLAFGFVAVLIGPAYFSKRRRNRLRLEQMRASEARQEAAARESALQALLSLQTASAVTDGSSDHDRAST
ncbi:MAG: hypothetical protein H7Z40_16360 [Phycisphaerae bacterium]|nr:hypothetical protein [Gemmatimonadaceae bacterium]